MVTGNKKVPATFWTRKQMLQLHAGNPQFSKQTFVRAAKHNASMFKTKVTWKLDKSGVSNTFGRSNYAGISSGKHNQMKDCSSGNKETVQLIPKRNLCIKIRWYDWWKHWFYVTSLYYGEKLSFYRSFLHQPIGRMHKLTKHLF